ncbi:MAG TPA: hypothetical protein VN520_09695 [Streptomyces sp.]|nr:hypothetical protein [Streptomyces sp.]HWU06640.1 hypothetical protein [Streptomyces sp.]
MAVALLTTSCAGQDGDASAPKTGPSAPAAPHGYVEGAQEAAEQQSRLLLNDPGTGATRVLDLITGKVNQVPGTTGTSGLTTDGRFGYLHTASGTRVLDAGTWTVDHGDHVHYYRAAIRDVGRIPAGTGADVHRLHRRRLPGARRRRTEPHRHHLRRRQARARRAARRQDGPVHRRHR